MSLFRRNDAPIVFVIFRVWYEELEPLKKKIVENGGAVSFNDTKMPIVFTQACNYSQLIWPKRNKTLVYDIKFIKECVRQCKIVDPEPYRLSEMPFFLECVMTHFLYGGCNCLGPGSASATALRVPAPAVKNRQIVVQTQSQTSTVADEDFFTPTSELSERGAGIANSTGNTEDPLDSSANLNRSVKRERSSSRDRGSLNSTAIVNIEINVLSPSQSSDGSSRSMIDESQAAVTRRATMNRSTELSGGDDRLTEAVDENEKRPCSVEYHTQLEPKLRVVAQRRKDMESSLGLGSKKRQQRTPTTLTDGRDAPSVVPGSENTSAILAEVTRSAPSCKNEGMDGGVIKNEPESSPSSPAKSDASTIFAHTSPNLLTSSVRKRLRSETAANVTPPESNWITSDDWQEQNDVSHPVSKYMRCDDGERRLLKDSQPSIPLRSDKPSRYSKPHDSSGESKKNSLIVLNPFRKNDEQNLKSPTSTEPVSTKDAEKSKYFEKPRVTCTSSTSDDSGDENILITRVPYTRENDNVMSVLSSDSEKEHSVSHTVLNDEDWNKPGPSGTKKHSSAREEISSDDSSQSDGSELRKRNRSNESCRFECVRSVKKIPNNKKDSANGEHLPRLRVRRPSDLESMISIDDEGVDTVSTRTRDKTIKNNKSVKKNKKSSKTVHREPSVDSSDSIDNSDRSSYNAKVIAARNKRTDHATTKSTSGRSEASDDRRKRRKNLNHNSMPAAKTTRARNGKRRSPSIEIFHVDSDSDDENTRSSTATVARTKQSGQNKHPSKAGNRKRDTCVSSATDSDSSSPSRGRKTNIARSKKESRDDQSGYRTWYSDSERRDIIHYIVNNQAISRCKGEAFFQVMASEKIFRHRTATSLYSEFRKMLKNIDDYARSFNLAASTVMQFKRLRGDYR